MKIYQSRWISRPISFKIFSNASLPLESTVSTLIDEKHKWDESIIMHHFDPEDAGKILKIPLSRTPKPDQMIWAYDKQDMYSVKNGYQVAFHLKFTVQPSSSKARQTDWNGIWKLEIPEKVKIFMWRAAHDLLHTAGNLWKKKVLQDL